MTDDAPGPDEDESPVDEPADPDDDIESTDERAATPDDSTEATSSASDGESNAPAGGDDVSDGRAHPWAPYDRDDPRHGAEFDAPTRDVRPGVDYDATRPRADPAELYEEIEALRDRLEEFESDVERRTVPRDELESDLRRYVRCRLRRGHARGWGPYLVFLYGTVMTLGAFYWLQGLTAIAAMIILWLSTLGLYVFMVVVGIGIETLRLPWKLRDRIGERRSS